MNEFNVLPESLAEFEPLGAVSVVRYEVLQYNLDGTAVKNFAGVRSFKELKDGLSWALESPRHLHAFTIPLPGTNFAGFFMTNPGTQEETLTLYVGDKMATVPKLVVGEYDALLNEDEAVLSLFVLLDSKKTTTFGNDVAWIDLSKPPKPPTLNFFINPGFYDLDSLATDMTYMLRRVNGVIANIFDKS